jgi:hypothetical protein
MSMMQNSTIAQFVFDRDTVLDLSVLVKELDLALQHSGAGQRTITWDCDDVALLDVEQSRFALSYGEPAAPDQPRSLMISVGPSPGSQTDSFDRQRHEALCHLIADRLKIRFEPDQTFWHNVKGPVTADLIDDLFDRLPEFDATPKRPIDLRSEPTRALRAFPETEPVSFAEKALAVKAAKAERARVLDGAEKAATIPEAANSLPPILRPPRTELGRVRAALYAEPEPQESKAQTTRMRLAAHTMDTTLMLVFLPAGAAMLTYSVLKGGNVNASARMMAVTCTILGLSQFSPWASEIMRFV